MNNLSTTSKLLMVGIVLVQIFDAIIHIATDQLEPIRITSNIVILLWSAAVWFGWLKGQFRTASLAALGIYLLLNGIFLAQNGLTNQEQGDAPRTMLFLLVMATTVLSGWVIVQIRRGRT